MRYRDGTWPVGQVVKTEASHAFNIGSNPVRVTIFLLSESGKVNIMVVTAKVVTIQLVLIRARVHPFPSRTRKLSSLLPTILGWRRPGKIGSANTSGHLRMSAFSFCKANLVLLELDNRGDGGGDASWFLIEMGGRMIQPDRDVGRGALGGCWSCS